jgi:hypothetical protein
MEGTMSTAPWKEPRGAVALLGSLVVGLVTVACSRGTQGPADTAVQQAPAGPRATPAPGFAANTVTSADRQTLVRYGDSLRFAIPFEQADGRFLRNSANDTGRTYVRVIPEVGSRALSREELKQGRIIALAVAARAYAPWQMAAGKNYIWVDSIDTGWRVVIIPADLQAALGSLTVMPLDKNNHPTGGFAYARILNEPPGDDDRTPPPPLWLSCGPMCCEVREVRPGPRPPPPAVMDGLANPLVGIPGLGGR